MRELSLFSGGGGGLLGTHHLLRWHPVGYVEVDQYCQRVIRRRIDDGYLPAAPIFGDIRAFLRDGYAESYSGLVDVVTAGFPCQPFSVAGRRAGEADDRNLWPETIATIRSVRPRHALLENVPGLLAGSHGYFGRVLGDLAEAGYDAEWCVLGGHQVDCPVEGLRLWVAATAHCVDGPPWMGVQPEHSWARPVQQAGDRKRLMPQWWRMDPPRGDGRMDAGMADRVDRLTALGNGQVPALAAAAWDVLQDKE